LKDGPALALYQLPAGGRRARSRHPSQIAAGVDFEFLRSLAASYYSQTGQPSVDPVVIFKLHLLGYLFNVRSERQLREEAWIRL
jgi:transposase